MLDLRKVTITESPGPDSSIKRLRAQVLVQSFAQVHEREGINPLVIKDATRHLCQLIWKELYGELQEDFKSLCDKLREQRRYEGEASQQAYDSELAVREAIIAFGTKLRIESHIPKE